MNISQLLKSERSKYHTLCFWQIWGVVFLVMTVFASALQAQTNLTMKPFQVRVEVPVGFTGTYLITNCNLRIPTNGASGLDGTGTNWIIANVNVSISGAPAGVTASLVCSDLTTPVGSIPINMNTNNASKSTNLVVKLDFSGSQAAGVTTLTMTASGGGLPDDTFLLPLEVAKIWNGSANAGVNGAGSWSDVSQWQGGVPGANDVVVFADQGTQTNLLFSTSISTNLLTNSIVDTTTVISALRFCQTNATGTPTTNYHNLYINPGVTLAIKGNDGFKFLRDFTFWTPKMNVTISGTNGTLVQTNENSDFALLNDGANGANAFAVLDMSRLGTLRLDVNKVNIGDIFGYPNYLYFATNGYNSGSTLGSSRPQKIQPTWNMALTNIIKAVYADPQNYTSSFSRNYAMIVGRNDLTGGSSGNDQVVSMGLTNAFFMDGICVGGFGSLGAVLNFQTTNSFALFRGTNGGRMSIFSCGDAAGTVSLGGVAGVNTKCGNSGFGVDFTRGTVDILVDKFFMSMDRGLTTGGGGQIQSSLGLSRGTIDANAAYICYQASGNQTNVNNCVATLTVSNIGVFKVNGTLALGYTASTAGDPSSPQTSYGKINIGPGGTVMASNITVGGITKATGGSGGNNITMSGGASLIVSNGIADSTPYGALGSLTMSGGNNSVTLFADGTKASAAIVYLTNLVASGTGNKLIIGGVTNLTYPAYVPLILGVSPTAISASAFDAGVTMPPGSGLFGTLVTSSSNTIDLQIISRSPNNLVWRGPAGGSGTADWDYTTKNWLDRSTGIMTNYENPDIVTFDDTPGYATNINLAGVTAFTPSSMTVTNVNLYYTFSGGNQINGGPTLTKKGTGILQIDGQTTCSIQLNQGVVIGSGSIGNATIAPGGVLYYSGSLNGSLNCSGIATTLAGISGSLTVLSGGVATNSGTASGAVTVQTGGLLMNSGTLNNIGTGSSGSPQVATNATLINGNAINGDVLFINGTLEDLGGSANMTLTSVSFGPNAVFIPGGDGIGTTTVNSDGVGSFPGAILFSQGSQAIFKIDPATPANTVAKSSHLSFGASASQQTVNGGTLIISNTTLTPFSAGQSFHLFDNVYIPGTAPFNTGSSTNTYPVISPATPGPGLSWDLSQLWSSGSIGVITTPVITLTNSFSVVGGSNIVSTFSWPADQQWVLQTLQSTLDVGLTATNWTRIGGSWTNTDADVTAGYRTRSITNNITTNSATFFRLVFP